MTIFEFVVWLASGAKILGIFILIFLVLPHVWKEMQVDNGLGFLRRSIFTIIFLYIFMNVFSLIPLISNPEEVKIVVQLVAVNYFFIFINLLNGFGVLSIAVIFYLIYNKDYGRVELE